MSTRGIYKHEYAGKYEDPLRIPKPTIDAPSPVRRNRLHFLNSNSDDITIDNLPWEGEDSLL